MGVRWGVLGPVEASRDGHPVTLGGRRPRTLVAMLVLHANRTVSTDRLVEGVWGPDAPGNPVVSLRSYVSHLRDALGQSADPSLGPLVTRPGGYELIVEPGMLDADQFREFADTGRQQLEAGRAVTALQTFDEALSLWRGEPLGDVDCAALVGEVERLLEARVAVEEDRVEALLTTGATAAAVAEAARLVALHPLRERLRRLLMLAYYRSGRQADALAVYSAYRSLVREELGLDPGRELRRLEEAILQHEPSLDEVGSPASLGSGAVVDGAPTPTTGAGVEFVGRELDMSALERALTRTRAGIGSIAVVTGDAGIGKTRLLEEAARTATADGMAVYRGRCYEGDGTPPFWPWTEIVRSMSADLDDDALRAAVSWHADELGSLLPALRDRIGATSTGPWYDDPLVRFRMQDAIVGFLLRVSDRRPLLLFVDDIHWADRPSLLCLRHVASAVARHQVLVAVACRDEAPDELLAETLADLARTPGMTRLALRGLHEDDVHRLVAAHRGGDAEDDLIRALHARTGGNPFFLGELLQVAGDGPLESLLEDLPTGVRDVISRRVQSLPPAAVETLRTAACEREWFRAEILARALDADARDVVDHLDLAMAARLVADDPDQPGLLRFSHALIRETLYASISSLRKPTVHAALGRAAVASEDVSGPTPLEDLARHFYLGTPAGTQTEAVDYARRAAREASLRLACAVGADHLGRALAVMERTPHPDLPERTDVLIDRGFMLQHAGDHVGARRHLLDAARSALARDDAVRAATACVVLGGTYWGAWRRSGSPDDDVLHVLEQLLSQAERLPHEQRAAVLARCAAEMALTPDAAHAVALAGEAVAIAEHVVDERSRCLALVAHHRTLAGPADTPRRAEVADHIVAAARDLWPFDLLALGHHLRSVDRLEIGDVAGWQADVDDMAHVSEEYRLATMAIPAAWAGAARDQLAGRLDAADAAAHRAADLHRSVSTTDAALTLLAFRFRQHRLRGRTTALIGELRHAAEHEHGGPDAGGWAAQLAIALAESGRHDEAADLLHRTLDDGFPRSRLALQTWADLSEVAAILEDRASAARLADDLEPFQGRYVVPGSGEYCLGSVEHWLGLCAWTIGDRDAAVTFLDRAVTAHRRLSAPRLEEMSRGTLQLVLTTRGAPRAARSG